MGDNLYLENKVYIDLVPVGTSPASDTSLRGAAHGFGNTEERLIHMNFGVEACDGGQRFDSAAGHGRLPRRALRQGQHASPHAAQPVGRARAGCRGPP
eukprot:5292876-Prymnesium_polylepis.1